MPLTAWRVSSSSAHTFFSRPSARFDSCTVRIREAAAPSSWLPQHWHAWPCRLLPALHCACRALQLWVAHLLKKPSFKGRVAVPLARVLAAGRLHDTFPLEDVAAGRLELSLEWLSTMQAV